MQLTDVDRDRVRQEEMIRWEVREERRRNRRPRLLLITIIWTAALTALALLNHIH